MKYDVVLVEKPGEEGLTKKDIDFIYPLLVDEEAFPVDINANHVECSAIGFVAKAAAEKLSYQAEGLMKGVAEILDDMNLESETGEYDIAGLSVFIIR